MQSAASAAYPRLVGDIGGTNTRLALVDQPGAPLSHLQVLRGADYTTIDLAIRTYLDALPLVPRSACLGIANPIKGDQVRMTNLHWTFSASALCRELQLERLLLLNDFAALAWGLGGLQSTELIQIGGGVARPGPRGLIGPGTGLGVSGVIPSGEGDVVLSGEGGHATLCASTSEEAEVIAWLWKSLPHVSLERVLSGPGLVTLYQALAAVHGLEARPWLPKDITQHGCAGTDDLCRRTVDMFCAFLGSAASNLALTLGATGGVYLGGGILPTMQEHFRQSAFRDRFEAKGRFSAYLADIPTYLMDAPYCALIGAARALDVPRVLGSVDVRARGE